MIIKNNKNISSVMKGTTAIEKIYKGATKIWEAIKELIVQGIPPLTLNNSAGKNLINYQIYGKSIQDGIPNPSNPVEIQSVGDKTKNLVDKSNWIHGYFDTVNEVFKEQSNSWNRTSYYISVNENTDYVCSLNQSIHDINIYELDNNKHLIKTIYQTNMLERKITTTATTKYIIINLGYGAIFIDELFDTFNIQLEQGSTATSYEPYGYKIPVNVRGKNLLSFTNQDFTLNGIRYYAQNGSLYMNGTSIGETTTDSQQFKDNFSFTLKAGTYYINRDTLSVPFALSKKSDNTFIRNTKGSFTLDEDTEIYLGFYIYNKTFNNNLINKMLNLGSTEIAYEPYFNRTENIYLDEPLRKIGNADVVKLPDGYTQLDYIESTGTQYIDTNITATNNTGMKIKYMYTANGPAGVSGIFKSTSPRQDVFFISSQTGTLPGQAFVAHNGYTSQTSLPDIVLNTDYTMKINYNNDGKIYYNDDYVGDVGTLGLYNSTMPLFARYSVSGKNYSVSNSRIYYVEFTEGNTISHKFIPAKNSSGTIGMYDLVDGVFYSNQGTGTFTAGPVIYADYIDFENQKAYRNAKEIALDGTELVQKYSAGTYSFSVYSNKLKDIAYIPTELDSVFCNYLMHTSRDSIWRNRNNSGYNLICSHVKEGDGGYVLIMANNYTTPEELSSWLTQQYANKTPVRIVYPLETPIEESIELPDILLNKGTNIISVETEIAPSNMLVKYKSKN